MLGISEFAANWFLLFVIQIQVRVYTVTIMAKESIFLKYFLKESRSSTHFNSDNPLFCLKNSITTGGIYPHIIP